MADHRGGRAVCPGTYDPVTFGHLDIIARAAQVFDQVIIGVVNKPVRKGVTVFSTEDRVMSAMRASLTRSAHAVERGESRRPHPWPSGPTSCLCSVPHNVAIVHWCVVAKPPLDMPLLPSRGDWTV